MLSSVYTDVSYHWPMEIWECACEDYASSPLSCLSPRSLAAPLRSPPIPTLLSGRRTADGAGERSPRSPRGRYVERHDEDLPEAGPTQPGVIPSVFMTAEKQRNSTHVNQWRRTGVRKACIAAAGVLSPFRGARPVARSSRPGVAGKVLWVGFPAARSGAVTTRHDQSDLPVRDG